MSLGPARSAAIALALIACTTTPVAPGTVTTVAGAAEPGLADGVGAEARFFGPVDVAIASSGAAYVADEFNHRICRVTGAGEVTTIAGTGVAGFADGDAASAEFNLPAGVVELGGVLYVADAFNAVIRAVDLASGQVSTLVGSPGVTGLVDGTGASARFGLPFALDADPTAHTLWVVDKNANTIRIVDLATLAVRTLAGDGTIGARDGVGAAAHFNSPSGIALDGHGGAWIADTGNHLVRHVDADGSVTTEAGRAMASGYLDGSPRVALLDRPWGIAVLPDGDVVFTEQFNNTVRTLTPGESVRFVAGRRWDGSALDAPAPADGAADAAVFVSPAGMAVTSTGDLLVCDHHSIRRVSGWMP